MARRRKSFDYEPPIPDEELADRMSSSAARKLEDRLRSMGWTGGDDVPVADDDES